MKPRLGNERFAEWVDVSWSGMAALRPELAQVIQGLGRIDVNLIAGEPGLVKMSYGTALSTEHMMLSYLWVLGAYEVVRTISQWARAQTGLSPTLKKKIANTKALFERIRIPLAKLEPSRRHRKTDFAFPLPILEKRKDQIEFGWAVARSSFMTRRGLADEVLALLKAFKAGEE